MLKQPEGMDKSMRAVMVSGFKLVAFATIIGVVGIASSFFLGDDNPIEEGAEALIQTTTGHKIDLSKDAP